MAGNSTYIVVCTVLAAGVALGAAGLLAPADPAPNADLHQALQSLQNHRYQEAERRALLLATDPAAASPRAWSIVAAARQRSGQYEAAERAYRLYLASSDSPATRQYALEQIRACQQALQQPKPLLAPSKKLSPAELAELARVDDKIHAESSDHFVVKARNAKLAKLLAAEAEVFLEHICRDILAGQAFPHSVQINVWADHDDYRAHATEAPDWAGATFRVECKDGLITRQIDLTQRDENGNFAVIMIDRALPHEMCHLVVREYFGDAACPLFLNEGLAMLAESTVDNARVELAGKIVAGKARTALESLLVQQRHDVDKPILFYAESFSFVDFLRGRLTKTQFRSFLDHVKGGCAIGEAIQRTLYQPPDESFAAALASAWEDHAVAQSQYLRALRGEDTDLAQAQD